MNNARENIAFFQPLELEPISPNAVALIFKKV
jgi:hypothetical protein